MKIKLCLKKRRRIIFLIAFVTIILICWYVYLMQNTSLKGILNFVEDVIAMALSALLSTFLAIWLTKNDILEDDFLSKKEKFGIITFEEGYKSFFINEDGVSYLQVHDWKDFFIKKNSQKEIDIVGITLNNFFDGENSDLPQFLLMLCLKENYKITIILANPYREEINLQDPIEYKENFEHGVENIEKIYFKFMSIINKLDIFYEKGELICEVKPSQILNKNFNIMFSISVLKAFIVRSGKHMIITPYLTQENDFALSPTYIVKESEPVGLYDKYKNYILELKKNCQKFESLQRHILTKNFFDQPYGENMTQEFRNDLRNCMTLDIMGLGQNKMFTGFEKDLIEILQRGGKIRAIMTKPEGASTEMCVSRSLIHNNLETVIAEHKRAINFLLSIRDQYANNMSDVKVYTWDCLFPYTMYAFNMYDPANSKMYIWINNLFAYSNDRDGFVIEGRFEPERIEKYKHQYEQAIEAAIKAQGEQISILNAYQI